MKRSLAVLPAVALAAALGLVGCSADAAPQDCIPEGSASKSVTITGKPGSELELTSKTPVKAEALERSVVTEGDGDQLKDGDRAEVIVTMFNGKNGKLLSSEEVMLENNPEVSAAWVVDSLKCSSVGDRVVSVAPATDIFGPDRAETSGFEDLTSKDSLVLVFDVKSILPAAEPALDRAEGTEQPAPKGFPSVKLAEDGAPTITIPKDAAAPTKLEIATLIEGDGPVVKPGDNVTVHYTGVIWRTGETFDSSWDRGAPVDFATTGVIGGFQKALEGQKVGSQIISVVPAEDGGYGAAGLEGKGFQKDDVMVFVLDILAIK